MTSERLGPASESGDHGSCRVGGVAVLDDGAPRSRRRRTSVRVPGIGMAALRVTRITRVRSVTWYPVGPALLDVGRALVFAAAVDAGDHPDDPTQGVREPMWT